MCIIYVIHNVAHEWACRNEAKQASSTYWEFWSFQFFKWLDDKFSEVINERLPAYSVHIKALENGQL